MKLNLFNTVSYILIFFVLILGAFFRFYNTPIFKALVPIVIVISSLYFYSKKDILAYLKIGILVLFLGHSANQYIYILITLILFNYRIFTPLKNTPVKYLYLMLLSGFLSFLISQAIEINLLGFPFFIASFFLPIIFFLIAHKYVDLKMKDELLNFYKNIILVLAFSAIIQIIFKGSSADGLTGGTTSAHTLGFHLGVVFILIASKVIILGRINHVTMKELLILSLTLPLMYFSDAKYLMGNMIISILIVYILFHTHKIVKPIIIGITILIMLNSLNYIQNNSLQLSSKASVNFTYLSYRFLSSAKFQLLAETLSLPINDPQVFIYGSGPGTFLSRAANSRAFDTMDKTTNIGGGAVKVVDSNLPSFISAHTSWVTHKYAKKYFQTIWYGTLYDYRSSIISLFWEFGIIGFSLFIMFFIRIFKKTNNIKRILPSFRSEALFVQSLIIFYLLNSILAYYLEYPETQVLFWMFIGVIYNKEIIKEISFSYEKGH